MEIAQIAKKTLTSIYFSVFVIHVPWDQGYFKEYFVCRQWNIKRHFTEHKYFKG